MTKYEPKTKLTAVDPLKLADVDGGVLRKLLEYSVAEVRKRHTARTE